MYTTVGCCFAWVAIQPLVHAHSPNGPRALLLTVPSPWPRPRPWHRPTPQSAPDRPWLVLYIAVVATCRTLAEWRVVLLAGFSPRLPTLRARFYCLAGSHVLSGLVSVLVTGLVTTWMPLLGQSAAAGVVWWVHLLGLPMLMVAAMTTAWRPLVSGRVERPTQGQGQGGGFCAWGTRTLTVRVAGNAGGAVGMVAPWGRVPPVTGLPWPAARGAAALCVQGRAGQDPALMGASAGGEPPPHPTPTEGSAQPSRHY